MGVVPTSGDLELLGVDPLLHPGKRGIIGHEGLHGVDFQALAQPLGALPREQFIELTASTAEGLAIGAVAQGDQPVAQPAEARTLLADGIGEGREGAGVVATAGGGDAEQRQVGRLGVEIVQGGVLEDGDLVAGFLEQRLDLLGDVQSATIHGANEDLQHGHVTVVPEKFSRILTRLVDPSHPSRRADPAPHLQLNLDQGRGISSQGSHCGRALYPTRMVGLVAP